VQTTPGTPPGENVTYPMTTTTTTGSPDTSKYYQIPALKKQFAYTTSSSVSGRWDQLPARILIKEMKYLTNQHCCH